MQVTRCDQCRGDVSGRGFRLNGPHATDVDICSRKCLIDYALALEDE